MGRISASTLRRIYLLYLLSRFEKGAFGAVRVQKVTYISEREAPTKVFGYKRYHFGEYSQTLDDLKDQLESMGCDRARLNVIGRDANPIHSYTERDFTAAFGQQRRQL